MRNQVSKNHNMYVRMQSNFHHMYLNGRPSKNKSFESLYNTIRFFISTFSYSCEDFIFISIPSFHNRYSYQACRKKLFNRFVTLFGIISASEVWTKKGSSLNTLIFRQYALFLMSNNGLVKITDTYTHTRISYSEERTKIRRFLVW